MPIWQDLGLVRTGCGACCGKFGDATFCWKFQQIGMCQTASEFSCGGRGVSPRGIIHYTDDSTIAATAMVGKSSRPYRATELRQCALLMQLALPVAGHALRLIHGEQQVLRNLVSHCVEHAVEFLVDWWPLCFQLRSTRSFPISPSLNAADLTEIWARYARSSAKVKFG
jgi:hypothetical protein